MALDLCQGSVSEEDAQTDPNFDVARHGGLKASAAEAAQLSTPFGTPKGAPFRKSRLREVAAFRIACGNSRSATANWIGTLSRSRSRRVTLRCSPQNPCGRATLMPHFCSQDTRLMNHVAVALALISAIGATRAKPQLDAAERHRVIAAVIANLELHYLDPELPRKMAE